ncbi:MAG: PEGA domain-containing protein [Bdellovibrionota bacterium]
MKLLRTLAIVGTFTLASCVKKPPPAPPVEENQANKAYFADDTPVDESFSVQSTPSGAAVKFSSGETCRTPCTVTKKNTDNFDLQISKDGYRSTKVSVITHARVVPGSGASGHPQIERPHLEPNPVSVTLEPSFKKH